MKTFHSIYFGNSNSMPEIESESIDLILTSPPYPMIEMWDEQFSMHDQRIRDELSNGNGQRAFELMHSQLDHTWKELFRITKKGGFVCLNIGDATRTIGDNFCLYSNHVRILDALIRSGFTPLPCILWRKQTNAPNKFMGSGTLPSGAYVTLEHEYILILRKGRKRTFFSEEDKQKRRESAIFWEERNNWYSDIWMDVKGVVQGINDVEARKRSAAFPFEIAHRLICMYSVQGDVVLDPFFGTGTTMLAAMAAARNSVGYEIDSSLKNLIHSSLSNIVDISNNYINGRLNNHIQFVSDRIKSGKDFKYTSKNYGFPVVTSPEQDVCFRELRSIEFNSAEKMVIDYKNNFSNYDSALKNHKQKTICSKNEENCIAPKKTYKNRRLIQLPIV